MAPDTEKPMVTHDRSPVWVIVASTLGVLLIAVALLGLTLGADAPGRPTLGAAAKQVTPASVGGTEVAAVRSAAAIPQRPKYRLPPGAMQSRSTNATPAAHRRTIPARPKVDLAPLAIKIPAIGVTSPLVRLGLNPDNTLQVPTEYGLAGWYIYRPVPGEIGPSVIAGHVDSKVGPAVFYRLKELQPGATIEVDRNDGSVALFSVTTKEQVDKNAFPTARVYGPTATSELRLITCAGTFNYNTGHYNDNLIMYAKLAKIVR
ncbi:MAG: Sortase family enzyme [Actinomycetia bacterium]|nr:Sortase family enzyme [Actinomycetes bacterium]